MILGTVLSGALLHGNLYHGVKPQTTQTPESLTFENLTTTKHSNFTEENPNCLHTYILMAKKEQTKKKDIEIEFQIINIKQKHIWQFFFFFLIYL